jgi:hypothetical protein
MDLIKLAYRERYNQLTNLCCDYYALALSLYGFAIDTLQRSNAQR